MYGRFYGGGSEETLKPAQTADTRSKANPAASHASVPENAQLTGSRALPVKPRNANRR
ncbi:hypothetical protein MPNT_30116 [Candidatus Methylacidithermus pantelleriae]|uniref:Uncharacterized protein n=2 Tax=Candidatus Methylacidithermus pantelleriae TaxID=2744239 RepID=A0A8J2BNP4_9BACT|nr:hypothetical protein MPNT_30116 [Candidatus Methylacidithermus pantelleriae]